MRGPDPLVTLSIVSHEQGALVAELIADISARLRVPAELLLTLNVPETLPLPSSGDHATIRMLRNATPKGFGANHNAAFRQARAPFFCVMNPDLRLADDPFPPLLAALADNRVGVVAPLVLAPGGEPEDSARRFPTVTSLARKALGRAARLEYGAPSAAFSPDWVAGMFMCLRAETFAAAGGFDERYHLYYEDVDLCWRLRARGFDVRVVPEACVTHHARRASRRDWRHFRWHVASALRYLLGAPRALAPLPAPATAAVRRSDPLRAAPE
jgi:hypothetical protein